MLRSDLIIGFFTFSLISCSSTRSLCNPETTQALLSFYDATNGSGWKCGSPGRSFTCNLHSVQFLNKNGNSVPRQTITDFFPAYPLILIWLFSVAVSAGSRAICALPGELEGCPPRMWAFPGQVVVLLSIKAPYIRTKRR